MLTKRLLPLLLILILLSACASGTPTVVLQATLVPGAPTTAAPTATPIPPTATPEPTPTIDTSTAFGIPLEDLAGTTIEFWHPFGSSYASTLTLLTDQFNTTNPYGVTVLLKEHDSFTDLYWEVRDAVWEDTLPALTIGYNNQFLSWNAQPAAIAGGKIITPLDVFIVDPVVGFPPAEFDDFYPNIMEQDRENGRQLGFPAYRSGQVLFYNVTWARELGFNAPPTTSEAFQEQACASAAANLADADPTNDHTGGWLINTTASSMAGWLFAFGADLESPDGGYQFETPEAEAAFTFLRELTNAGCAWSPDANYPNPEFATRQGLFFSSSIAGFSFQQEAFDEAGNADEWTSIPFPGPDGQTAINIYGPAFVITAQDPLSQLAAWLFIRDFTSPAAQAAWTQTTGYFPVRASAIEQLAGYQLDNPQWAAAQALLPLGHFEPRLASWSNVRGVLTDATTRLFEFGFAPEQVPNLLAELQWTAEELHVEYDQ